MRSAAVLSTLVGLAASSHAEIIPDPAVSKIGIPFGIEARSPADFPLPTAAPDHDGIHVKMAGPPHKSCTDGIFCASHAPSAPILPRQGTQTRCKKSLGDCAATVTPAPKRSEADINTLEARAWETPCPYEFAGTTIDYTCTNKKEYKTYLREMKTLDQFSDLLDARAPAVTPAAKLPEADADALNEKSWKTPCPFTYNGVLVDNFCTKKKEYKSYLEAVSLLSMMTKMYGSSASVAARAPAITPAPGPSEAGTNTLDARWFTASCPFERNGNVAWYPCKYPTNGKEYQEYKSFVGGIRSIEEGLQSSRLKSLGADFTVAVTLSGTGGSSVRTVKRPTQIPGPRSSNLPTHRPQEHSTQVSFPTTLSVPLEVDDEGHVSVIGQRPTGNRHHNSAAHPAASTVYSVRVSGAAGVSTILVRPSPNGVVAVPITSHGRVSTAFIAVPTSRHHHDHVPTYRLTSTRTNFVAVPTSKHHHDHHHAEHHSNTAPTFMPVLVSDHGHTSTAFYALPTSKHHHHDHHKSKHHSSTAPSFMPVLVSDHGHTSTAFVAVPTSKHQHHEHHKSKHHSSSTILVPVVIGSHRPVPTSDLHHQSGHHGTTTIPLHLSLSTPSQSCVPVPKIGNLPVSPRNDPVAFVDLPIYTSISKFNSKVPGAKSVFTNRQSRVDSPRHLLENFTMPKYDALVCSQMCTKLLGCRGFNVFVRRDPAMKLSPSCRNPPHYASAQCWLYDQPISMLNRSIASNFEGMAPFRFNHVYAASNGYDIPSTYPNWTGPGAVEGVYTFTQSSSPLLKQGGGQFIYQQTFAGDLDPAVCINTCDKINAGHRAQGFMDHMFNIKNDTHHGVKGRYRPCNFFNVFQTSEARGGSFTCSFWTLAPNNPPRLTQKIGGHKVESSLFYNRRYDDIGRFHQEDMIENAAHNITEN
ncbi:hypothetical protein IWZ00DRAFT_60595 [Phyllosticta capitalensis]